MPDPLLSKISLHNFKCFEAQYIKPHPQTLLVGANNAGKSTIMWALRLLSLVTSRFQNFTPAKPPTWTGLMAGELGVSMPVKGVDLTVSSALFNRYSDPPARIEAKFHLGQTITIMVGLEPHLFAVVRDGDGTILQRRSQARLFQLPNVSILPPVGPLEVQEKKLDQKYVVAARGTHLSPMHFRNQLLLDFVTFARFKELAEGSWKRLKIEEPTVNAETSEIMLNLTDHDFYGELSLMGHGLQIWLQVCWFIASTPEVAVVALDEPDVYLHADMQRRLVRLVRDHFQQFIIASHSVEIISEMDPADICVVDKSRKNSTFLVSNSQLQQVVDHLGGIHNLQLARLQMSKKVLVVEGDDITILREVFNTLHPSSDYPLDVVPSFDLGGCDNWDEALGSIKLLRCTGERTIRCYCILDRDYRSDDQVAKMLERARVNDLNLHIWSRKELENYLICPRAIHQLLVLRARKGDPGSIDQVAARVQSILEGKKAYVTEMVADRMQEAKKGLTIRTAMEDARVEVERRWSQADGPVSLAPGKVVLSEVSAWCQEEYGVGITPARLAGTLKKGDMPQEIMDVLKRIEKVKDFQNLERIH